MPSTDARQPAMQGDSRRLVLEPLSETSWRLCDHGVAASSADSVLAYIEQRPDGAYEVTWVVRGLGTATFATIDDLLRDASALLEHPRSRTGKPLPIAHRPPLRAS